MTENERVRRFAAALEPASSMRPADCSARATRACGTTTRSRSPSSICSSRLAEAAGAYGARLLGGGFGGSVLMLVDRERGDEVGDAVADEYGARTGRAVRALTVDPSAGAGLQSPGDERSPMAVLAAAAAASYGGDPHGVTRSAYVNRYAGSSSRYRGCVSGPQLAVPRPRCA